MKKLWQVIKHRWNYRKTWGTTIGQDCIDLDITLCEWLGHRLIFLSEHGNSYPTGYIGLTDEHGNPANDDGFDAYKDDLRRHGTALIAYGKRYDVCGPDEVDQLIEDARDALKWVTQQLPSLWD